MSCEKGISDLSVSGCVEGHDSNFSFIKASDSSDFGEERLVREMRSLKRSRKRTGAKDSTERKTSFPMIAGEVRSEETLSAGASAEVEANVCKISPI